jgi:hypothetical protein
MAKDTTKASTALAVKRAQEKKTRETGQAFDEAFKLEAAALRQHILENFPSERGDLDEMIDQGGDILRSIAWGKKSIQTLEHDGELLQEDKALDYEKEVYNHRYIDAMAKEIVRVAKSVHLTPELVRFEVRVLEAVTNWVEHDNNALNFEWLDILKKELAERRAGRDTFELPKPAPKKRGRKPQSYYDLLAKAEAPKPEPTPPPLVIPANYEL